MALLTLSYRHRLLLYSDKLVLLMNTICNAACWTKLLQPLLMSHFTYQPFQSYRNIPKIQPYCTNYPKSSLRTVDIDKNYRVREIVVLFYWSTIETVCLNKNADVVMVFVYLRTDVSLRFCAVENAEEQCSHITDRCFAPKLSKVSTNRLLTSIRP